MWYEKDAPEIIAKSCKTLLHEFKIEKFKGLTFNPYQGCHHRCFYCYAAYKWNPDFFDRVYYKENAYYFGEED